MVVHLITMIGHSVTTLRPMLAHYAALGISSFWIFVHVEEGQPNILPEVKELTAPYSGVDLRVVEGEWLPAQEKAFAEMQTCPGDWFILADQDEFQLYPTDLIEILQECDRNGIDHIKGALVDRIAEDGSLAPFHPNQSIWEQYPIGVFLTFTVGGGDCRKVAAAKGSVRMTNGGHHRAVGGSPCPASQLLVQVHHFKWIDGLVSYLQSRRSPTSPNGKFVLNEAHRFLVFYENNGDRIAVEEPGLLAQRCNPHYPKWSVITGIVTVMELFRRVSDSVIAADQEVNELVDVT